MKGTLTMSHRELERLKVIHSVIQKRIPWSQAARQLNLCRRQIGYMCARVRREGNTGIIHRLRGRPSNHQLDPVRLKTALDLVEQKYPDFGPTFANEKLREIHGVVVSTFSLRQGMIQRGLWRSHKQRTQHRAWRERRPCLGQLIQLDGSPHAWFESRGPKCTLLIYIDDATSRILHGEFVDSEDTHNLMKTTRDYLLIHGRPGAFYVDRDSIYKTSRQPSIEEQLQGDSPLPQFTRAMKELDIEVLCAFSPQAKGRVERGFKTHQDRLVKELRLAGISDIDAANRFLKKIYIPRHNDRFAVAPAQRTDAHRALLPHPKIDEILSIRVPRVLANDFTLRHNNRFFQITPVQPLRVRPRDIITIEIRLDGSVYLRFKGALLNYKSIPKKPCRTPEPIEKTRAAVPWKPPKDHPWRKAFLTPKKHAPVQFL